jgi:hypothetical protein
MPIVLSSAEQSFREPKRKNRWILKFDSVPNAASSNDASEALAIDIFSASRPSVSVEPIEIHRLNERFWFASKPSWESITCTFYDFDKGKNSAAQVLYSWFTSIYNPLTGGQGYAIVYKTNATLVLLGPDGKIIEVWDLFGSFPESVAFQDLSYDSTDPTQVEMTLKFDYAVLQSDTGNGGIPTS